MEILRRSSGRPTLVYLYRVYPLRVLKQVVTMFCSVNERRADRFPEVRKFVLNRHARPLPPHVRFFAYFHGGGNSRRAGLSALVRLGGGPTHSFSEISFPPYGYGVDSPPPDRRLADISHFDQYRPDEYATKELRMAALPTHLALPGDYRTQREIADQVEESRQWMGSREGLAATKLAR